MNIFDDRYTIPVLWDTFYPVLLYFFLPAALLCGHFELVNRGRINLGFIKIKKNYELNRQTGMVTLFQEYNNVRFSHPFIEFD